MDKILLFNLVLFIILPILHILFIKFTNSYNTSYLYIIFFFSVLSIHFFNNFTYHTLIYISLMNTIYLISYHFVFMGIIYDSPTLKIIELIYLNRPHQEIENYFKNSNIVETRYNELLSSKYIIEIDEDIALTKKSFRLISLFRFIRKFQNLSQTKNG